MTLKRMFFLNLSHEDCVFLGKYHLQPGWFSFFSGGLGTKVFYRSVFIGELGYSIYHDDPVRVRLIYDELLEELMHPLYCNTSHLHRNALMVEAYLTRFSETTLW